MPIDVDVQGTPGWWMQRCWDKLHSRQERLKRLFDRYEGEPWEPDWMATAPDTAQRFYRSARTGFAEMIVKAPRRRLRVTSLLTAVDSSEIGDEDAWRVWRRAGMVSESLDITRTMLIAGDAYAILGVDDDGPYATAEDPRQVVTIHDPIRQSRIRAAAKFFADPDTGEQLGYLYMPGRRYVASATRAAAVQVRGKAPVVSWSPREWDWHEDLGGADGEEWPAGLEDFVGVVRYRNDEGVGEYERHEDILYRIDHLILQGMVIATMQAFRQRAIKVDPDDMPDEDPETGERIDYNSILAADPGALWKLPETAELWESGQVDLTGILQMVEKEMQRLSAVTFTPLSMFNSDAVNQSAAGAELVKEGLTDKVAELQERMSQPHAEVASGLLRLSGDAERADLDALRVGWAPPVRYSLIERGQAAVNGEASGVPWRTRMREFWQFSPEEIARMESERQDEAFMQPATAEAAPAATVEADALNADVVGVDGGVEG